MQTKRLFRSYLAALTSLLLATTGCVTSANRQAWLDGIQSKGVDEAVFQKIKRWRKIELTEIEQLAEKGVASEDILRHFQESRAVYHLTTKDIDRLRAAKVDEDVVDYILSTPKLEERRTLRVNPFYDPFCPPYRGYSRPYWP